MAEQAPNNQRIEPRKKKTLFCQLDCRGKRYPAVVLDLSPSGLFVRTATALPLGTEVEVTLRLAGGKAWSLRAEVAREPQADSSRDSLYALGLGLRITGAPDGFAEFVGSLKPHSQYST
jgi:hypothetical protein